EVIGVLEAAAEAERGSTDRPRSEHAAEDVRAEGELRNQREGDDEVRDPPRNFGVAEDHRLATRITRCDQTSNEAAAVVGKDGVPLEPQQVDRLARAVRIHGEVDGHARIRRALPDAWQIEEMAR